MKIVILNNVYEKMNIKQMESDNDYISIFTKYLQFEQIIYNCTLLNLYGSRFPNTIDHIRSTSLLVYLSLILNV